MEMSKTSYVSGCCLLCLRSEQDTSRIANTFILQKSDIYRNNYKKYDEGKRKNVKRKNMAIT